jgi:hypothetical protein
LPAASYVKITSPGGSVIVVPGLVIRHLNLSGAPGSAAKVNATFPLRHAGSPVVAMQTAEPVHVPMIAAASFVGFGAGCAADRAPGSARSAISAIANETLILILSSVP